MLVHAPDMPKSTRMPTQVGDVLILWTSQSFAIYAVGLVSGDGQQDVHGAVNVEYVSDRAAAVAKAKALVVPGRRIFLLDIDTETWSEISNRGTTGSNLGIQLPVVKG